MWPWDVATSRPDVTFQHLWTYAHRQQHPTTRPTPGAGRLDAPIVLPEKFEETTVGAFDVDVSELIQAFGMPRYSALRLPSPTNVGFGRPRSPF